MRIHHGEISTLSSAEKIEVLESERIAHLGCSSNGRVYVVPITYAFEDGYIYSHAREGQKIEAMRENPKVCCQVDHVKDLFHWKSVMAWGTFEELKGEAAAKAMRILLDRFGEQASTLEMDFASVIETAIIYRIKITETSGRSEGIS